MIRPRRRTWYVVVLGPLLAGCFTTSADYQRDAERYIRDDVASALSEDAGVAVEFATVECEVPIDQQVGTRFACRAVDGDGGVWEFDNVIGPDETFTVNLGRRP